eukprot:768562-Hanusia_phi.AAC.9
MQDSVSDLPRNLELQPITADLQDAQTQLKRSSTPSLKEKQLASLKRSIELILNRGQIVNSLGEIQQM